jgi:hypothetical protein
VKIKRQALEQGAELAQLARIAGGENERPKRHAT